MRKRVLENAAKTILFILLLTRVAYGQENAKVKGMVTDAKDGTALTGVSVLLKGSTTGTITDAEGNYSLLAPGNGVLVFSFIGYESIETENQHTWRDGR